MQLRSILLTGVLILLLSLIASSKEITVKVIVQSGEPNIRNKITSELKTQLRKKNSIKVTDDDTKDALYVIIVSTSEAKTDNNILFISISSVIVRRDTLKTGESDYIFKNNVVCTIKEAEIAKKCEDLIYKFDTENFERDRI